MILHNPYFGRAEVLKELCNYLGTVRYYATASFWAECFVGQIIFGAGVPASRVQLWHDSPSANETITWHYLDIYLQNNRRITKTCAYSHGVAKCHGKWESNSCKQRSPYNKVHGTNMGPTWGRKVPGGPHVPPYLAMWAIMAIHPNWTLRFGNGLVISLHTWMQLLVYVELKVHPLQ